jgi:hypothetical protein
MANSYKRYPIILPVTTQTTVLVVPAASTMIIRSIWVSNPNLTAGNILVEALRVPSGTTILVPIQPLAAGQYMDLMSQAGSATLVLEEEDSLVMTSDLADINGYVSALIVDRN